MSDSVEFSCACGKRLNLPENRWRELSQKLVRCPQCKNGVRVPPFDLPPFVAPQDFTAPDPDPDLWDTLAHAPDAFTWNAVASPAPPPNVPSVSVPNATPPDMFTWDPVAPPASPPSIPLAPVPNHSKPDFHVSPYLWLWAIGAIVVIVIMAWIRSILVSSDHDTSRRLSDLLAFILFIAPVCLWIGLDSYSRRMYWGFWILGAALF